MSCPVADTPVEVVTEPTEQDIRAFFRELSARKLRSAQGSVTRPNVAVNVNVNKPFAKESSG